MRTLVAGVAELVDAPDSKSGFFGSASSILALGTNINIDLNFVYISWVSMNNSK